MNSEDVQLTGRYVRLEPLAHRHAPGLLDAVGGERSLYRWSPVPGSETEIRRYIDTALEWKHQGTAVPFATTRASDGAVIGSTRFFELTHWAWPEGHPMHERRDPIACEIGYTWLNAGAIRTAANTEAKLLMLTHAFETWGVLRVCFHTDVRNERSRAALERIGARFEGVLRAHRLAADFTARDSARYSILSSEWPAVRERLSARVSA